MDPAAIGNAQTAPSGANTDLASADAQAQAAQFDQLIQSVGTSLMSVLLEDMMKLTNEDM